MKTTPITILILIFWASVVAAQTQPDPRVMLDQAGAANGQVLKSDGTKWVPGADNDMRWHSVKSTLPYYASPEATFAAMLAYYATRSGEIVIDTVVNITANTTISSAVRFTDQGRLNISTSITATFQSSLVAPPREQIFSGAGNVILNPKSCEAIYPYWFGALGNGSADDYEEIQKAIATSLASDLPKVKFLSGVHNISKGLLVKRPSDFVTITIEGEPAFDGTNYGTTLKATHNDNFVLGIQGARSCVIRDMYISGSGNTFNPSLNQVITMSDATWETNYGRDERYSPFSGIVLDPFANTTPADGGYPGFSGEYTGNAGSSAVTISGVVVRYCIVGIMLSPGNFNQNCSEMSIQKSQIDRCKVGIGVGSHQARSIEVLATNIALVQTGSTGLDYGATASPMPHFMNSQIGACRDMFRFNLNFGDCVATNIYSESVYRIGRFDGYAGAFTMTGCEINFTTFPETGVNDAASVLDMVQGGSFIMNGGKLVYSTFRAIEMSVLNASFVGATLFQPIFNVGNQYYTQGNVIYKDVSIVGYNSQYNNRILKPKWRFSEPQQFGGQLFSTTDQMVEVTENAGTNNTQTLFYNARRNIDVRPIEVVTVTVSGNTATFTSANVGKYQVGDILHTYNNNSTSTPSGNSKSCTFGIVSNILGAVVTCNQICAGTSSGEYILYSNELNRIIPAMTASITNGSPVITITNKPTGFTISSLFPVGSRVYGESLDMSYGIPNGAYVVSVSGDNITLSVNCTATLSDYEIFDADMRSEYISNNGNIPTLSNHCTFRKGDRIFFPAHAYRSEAIVTRGGGAPAVKMIFRPISGSTGSRPTPEAVDVGLEYFNTTTNTNQWWDGTTWREAGTGTVLGSGAANRVAWWQDATTLTSSVNFTYNGTNSVLSAPTGPALKLRNTDALTGAAGSGEYAALELQNNNATDGNYVGISWNAQGGSIASTIGGKVNSHSAATSQLELYTRHASGFGIRAKFDADNWLGGNVGLGGSGIFTPSQPLHVLGNARVTGAFLDSNNDPGTLNQMLKSTVTGTDWSSDYEVPLTFTTGLNRTGNTITNTANIFRTVNTTNSFSPINGTSLVATGLTDVLTLNSNSENLVLNTYNSGVKQVNMSFTPSFYDSEFRLKNGLDPTKLLVFNLDAIATDSTRTLSTPDASGTLALGTGAANQFARWNTTNTLEGVSANRITVDASDKMIIGASAAQRAFTTSPWSWTIPATIINANNEGVDGDIWSTQLAVGYIGTSLYSRAVQPTAAANNVLTSYSTYDASEGTIRSPLVGDFPFDMRVAVTRGVTSPYDPYDDGSFVSPMRVNITAVDGTTKNVSTNTEFRTRLSTDGQNLFGGGNLTLTLKPNLDVQIHGYPNTRDDAGTPTNFLSTDASGNMISNPTSILTGESSKIGTFQTAGTAKGLSLSLDSIRMHGATISEPGAVTVGAQSWTGLKEAQRTGTAIFESFRATNLGTGGAAYGFKSNGVGLGYIYGDQSGSQSKIAIAPNDLAEPTDYLVADGNTQKVELMKGISVAVYSTTGNYTIEAGRYYVCLTATTPGTYTFTLPPGAIGHQFVVVNNGSAGVVLSVVGNASDTVENGTSITLGALGETKTLTKISSTNWDAK